MKIAELLRDKGAEVVTITPEAGVSELLTLLADHGIGAVVVSRDGTTIDGIVSERDIVRRLGAAGADALSLPVEQIMTAQVRTCAPGSDLGELEASMTEHRIRHMPVVEDTRLVGIISIGDVVKQRIGTLMAERDQLRDYIQQ